MEKPTTVHRDDLLAHHGQGPGQTRRTSLSELLRASRSWIQPSRVSKVSLANEFDAKESGQVSLKRRRPPGTGVRGVPRGLLCQRPRSCGSGRWICHRPGRVIRLPWTMKGKG